MSRQIYAVCLKCLFSLVLLLSIGLPALGQSSSAAVNGIVQDTTDARIPNASVKLINIDTGTESNSKTSKDGGFVIPSVLPGHYRLQIERDGFDTTQLTGITLNVGDNKQVIIRMKVGSSKETVTVDGSGLTINTTDASVSTVIDRKFVENMPLNGRSFQDLISMTPGIVTQSPQSGSTVADNGDFSVNGQRTESNYYTVDGVTGNVTSGTGGGGPQAGTGGSLGGSTALGTTQSLISVDALQEFRVQSSTYSAEYGRSPGGQFSLITRSGTNALHGSAYDYLRNNFFDANDWFNDFYRTPTPALRQNDFGGTLGGPIWIPKLYDGKNRTFFFASYEGLRLTQPTAATIEYVPDTFMRQQAVPAIQPILNAYPIQNGIDYGNASSPSLAQFIASFSLPSRIDSTSVRIDQIINPKLTIFFRYGDTPSSTSSRPQFSLVENRINVTTYTAGATSQLSSKQTNEIRVGYDRSNATNQGKADNFGGATPINLASAMGAGAFATPYPVVVLYYAGIGLSDFSVPDGINLGRQWNLVDTDSISIAHHSLKFGIDYRRIKSPLTPAAPEIFAEFTDTPSVINNAPGFAEIIHSLPATPIFNETALFVQDEWRVSPSLGLSLGLRWEANPPPTEQHGNDAYTLQGNLANPSSLLLAPQGTPLWKTSWFDFAPRIGLAWTVRSKPGLETVVRAGGGIFFDTLNSIAASGYVNGVGFTAYNVLSGASIPFTPAQLNVPVSASAPYTSSIIYAFPNHLQQPYTIQWNTSVQQALGKAQTFTLTYVGANGRRLAGEQEFSLTALNPNFGTVIYFPGGLTSNYQALQVQFQRSVAHGIQALASYTWSHSIDFGSTNSALPLTRGNSDFDVRHNLQGGLSWDLPNIKVGGVISALLNDWGVDGRFMARTSFPITLTGSSYFNSGTGSLYYGGLNIVANQPLYLYGRQYPGGKVVNKAAFSLPASTTAIGNAPRNFMRGFGADQINFTARRDFRLHEAVVLQFRAEAFNILNHPNFGYVDPIYTDATFGQATKMLNSSLETVASQYQQGGPRSMQFALRLRF
jgi:hypothetical protein